MWYPLLAFAHLADRRPGAPEGEPDPIELVRAQAGQILGPSRVRRYRETSVDARQPVPREGEITLLPVVPGIEFNPARRTFCWLEDVHREEFSLRAAATADGTTARGRLMVYLGAILLAEIDLTIRVDSADHESAAATHFHADTKRPYRKIFASYSHRDVEIVPPVRGVGGILRRPLPAGCPRPPRRGEVGSPPPRADRESGYLPIILVDELDALVLRPERVGARTGAGSAQFHPADLLGESAPGIPG